MSDKRLEEIISDALDSVCDYGPRDAILAKYIVEALIAAGTRVESYGKWGIWFPLVTS